uniref:Uncharacterized protein n=1 Tax=Heterorhabditis bacteriophora TaxID=37862 RepID=A0A1I7WKN7_HETBA
MVLADCSVMLNRSNSSKRG